MAAKQGGYWFALHIKQRSTESSPTRASVSVGEELAGDHFYYVLP